MQGWSHGGLETEFEQRLDDLLADICPGWQPSEPLELRYSNERLRDYQRRNAKRIHLGDVLTARPDVAASQADRVFAAIVCDEDPSFNRQLVDPVLHAVGRRTVQRYLISIVETGPVHKKVCAERAWYWSQVTLVYESVEDLRQNRPTQASRAADDEVSDLRSRYRMACLAAFVARDHTPTRERLADGFLLVEALYPQNIRHLVDRARAIAEADPLRYKNLLARQNDGTSLSQLGRSDM